MTTPAAPSHLAALRLARGWSQKQAAERLNRLAWSLGHESAANSQMISKWERGTKGISPRYRTLLAQLYRVDAGDLAADPPAPISSPDESLLGMFDQAAAILNQLGPAGRALRPHVLATLAEDALTGRTILDTLDALPPKVRADPTEATLAELEQLTATCEALYGQVPAAALLTTVAAQVRAASAALDRDPRSNPGQRHLRNRARLSILAGRLAEDTKNTMAARAYYAQATDDAHEIGDPALAVVAIIYTARLAAGQGMSAAAGIHLRAARALAGADCTLTSWLADVELPETTTSDRTEIPNTAA